MSSDRVGGRSLPGASAQAPREGGSPRWLALEIVCGLLLGVASMAVYYPALSADFVYDDFRVVVDNALVTAPGVSLRAIFSQPFPSAQDSFAAYRPVTILSYRLNAGGGPPRAAGFHLVNAALHLLVTLLLYVFLRRAFAPRLPALLGALVFAVMPGHAEAVLFVSARGDLLVALACVLGFLAVSVGVPRWPPSPGTLCVLLAIYLVALLCKESAVTMPALALIAGTLRERQGVRFWMKGRRSWMALAAFAVPLLLYLGLRIAAVPELLPLEESHLAHASLLGRAAVTTRLVAVALSTLVWSPTPHALYFWSDPLRWDWQAIAGTALVALLVAIVVRVRDLPIRAGAAMTAIALLPHLRLLGGLELFSERYLYVPSLGLAILATGLAAQARRSRFRGWVAPVAVAWCVLLASQTLAYAAVWTDEVSLWQYTHRVVPGSPKALWNYGVALAKGGRPAQAKAAFEGLVHTPGYEVTARKGLLLALADLGNNADAIPLAHSLLAAAPDDADVLYLLGHCEAQAGDRQAASRTIERLARLGGSHPHAAELARRLTAEATGGRRAPPPQLWLAVPDHGELALP